MWSSAGRGLPRRAVCLHADSVNHRVGPPTPGHLTDLAGGVLVEIQHLDPIAARPLQALGNEVHADDPEAEVLGDSRRHVSDRPKTQHGDATAFGDVRVGDRLPGGGQHVREVYEALVGRTFGYLDVCVLGLRHAQILSLPAGQLPIELGVAEQGGAHVLVAHLGGLALSLQSLVAHEAVAAGDLEGDHHAVAGGQVGDLRTDLLDYAHRLVPLQIALFHKGGEDLVEVEVRAADGRRRHAHHRVGGLLYGGVRHVIYPNSSRLPYHVSAFIS